MLAFFSISPLGESESVSKPVSRMIDLISKSGLEFQVTAMGTIIEGPADRIFEILKACHATMKESHNRVTSKILIDDRGDDSGRIRSKIQSLEKHLGRKLQE
jgi:uncharacterized protein (TIGR00106 family)